MKFKRSLAVLMAVMMIVSMLVPTYATTAGKDAHKAPIKSEATSGNASSFENGMIVSPDGKTFRPVFDRDENGKLTVKLEEGSAINSPVASESGKWTATETNKNFDLFADTKSESLKELEEAAKVFARDEKVAAFVVMNKEPLCSSYMSIDSVPEASEEVMLELQDQVISRIERRLLDGEKLDVRYQFTYLTNSFTIETEFGNLDDIAKQNGVKSVFVMPVYETADKDETADPNTGTSAGMTGVTEAWKDLGYTGAGMKIAIIDTGLDLDHPSFAADPELTDSSMTKDDIAEVLKELNAYALRPTVNENTLYRSAKVPFAFNYVDASLTADHSADGQGDHGTHVAGIAAANKLEGTTVAGMAPDAQIIVMKVFGQGGGAYMDDICAALEDAMRLGCDVVNASLGSAAGFASSNSELDLIYERLSSYDIIANFSAGNEGPSSYGNMWGTDLNRTDNPDNAAIGSPSTWANTFSIASADNSVIMSPYLEIAGKKIFFQDSYQTALGYLPTLNATLKGETYEYYVVSGVGNAEEFYDEEGNSLVEGKIAVISRGEINYGTKVANAEAAGAVAAIVYNNNDTDDVFSMYMNLEDDYGSFPTIPAVMITLADSEIFKTAEEKSVYISSDAAPRPYSAAGQMSVFSSWGPSPDLGLRPDITGIGGNVYSCYDGGGYGLMSGTSMSSPQVAGISALVMQYLHEMYPTAPTGSLREMAMAILMSTADPIISSTFGMFEASPRQQGAGLVNAYEALTSEAYLTVGGSRPKAELGDNEDGVFEFSFEVHNFSDETKTYQLTSSLLTEYAAAAGDEYFMYGSDIPLDGTVSFNKDSVTVPAGGQEHVTVTITLADSDKAYFEECWENGGYVEGYVYLYSTAEDGTVDETLNLPFMGFYGDWTEAPVFDSAFWYEDSFWGAGNGAPDGDQYYNVMWTDLGAEDWVLGFNPYSGAMADSENHVIYDSAHNVVSPNGDGFIDGISEMYISLLRNAKEMNLTYTIDGEVVHKETYINNRKTMYNSNYGQIVPWLYSWYGMDMYDFTDADGNVLPTGTEVTLTIDAKVDYADGGEHQIVIPITVDVTKPELVDIIELEQDGQYLLGVIVTDETALAATMLMNRAGTQIYGGAYDVTMQDLGDGMYLAAFDVTDCGTEFTLAVCDYAANETYYDITYRSAADDNTPELPTDYLYGYRIYDEALLDYETGMIDPHTYGWGAIFTDGYYAALSDDYLEYAAINAADYAGGKLFGFDAVGNFVVMDPGLWNRTTIRATGANVLDMTFDDATDTMYVLVRDGSYVYLNTVDLLTGEMESLVSYGYSYYAPYAIADDDNGNLYLIKAGDSVLYTTTAEAEYALEPVMITVEGEDGEPTETEFVIMDAEGSEFAPSNHLQSMTYVDGVIYWTYYSSGWMGDASGLVMIDLESALAAYSSYYAQAYDQTGEIVTYYPNIEIVALHTLTETDYVIPETELEELIISESNKTMTLGMTDELTVSPIPWNCEFDPAEVIWETTDESIVTVSGGEVVAVGEGTATVTATVGELTAVCDITVVDISTTAYAYNYFSGDGNYGYMVEIGTDPIEYGPVAVSPVDFVAGDYNGHDGYFYGYNEGGQFWKYNIETGEAVKLGDPIGTAPADMAYDYSTGYMYAVTLDYNSGVSTLNTVSLDNGKLSKVNEGDFEGSVFGMLTLACDDEGNLYTLDVSGNLYVWMIEDNTIVNAGILMYELGAMQYMQSMCWDHENDVIIWAYCEGATLAWVDPWAGYAIALGDPTNAGMFEFVGMFTVPTEIEALPDVEAESLTSEDMMMLAGSTNFVNAEVKPYNATNRDVKWVSSDETVVKVNADGTVTAMKPGKATLTGTLGELTTSCEVTVIEGADNIYGHVLTDISSGGGQYWVRIYASDPSDPDFLKVFNYTLYAEEIVGDKIYAVGYDPNDWDANWQFMVLDADTYEVIEMHDVGEIYPFIYDMTYDPATDTMYAVAGYDNSGNDTDIYVVDMTNGAVTQLIKTEQVFMSIAAGKDGAIYAMDKSKEEVIGMDDWGWEIYDFTEAVLYAVDPLEGTVEAIGSTGIKSNMMASMSYDFDTDHLYWTPFFNGGNSYISGLSVVDTETGKAISLGAVGQAGAQVSGLYIRSDDVPEADTDTLKKVIVDPTSVVVTAGETVSVNALILPMALEGVEYTWTSADETIATVDENGVITGVMQGKTTVTVTATYNGVSVSADFIVGVFASGASFLTWNTTENYWVEISRADYTKVTPVSEADELASDVVAIASIKGVVYGYDENGQLFKLDLETYTRENIGEGIGLEVEEGFKVAVQDMAYDKANERMLVLGATMMYDDWWGGYAEIEGGTYIYSVDLETGELTELCNLYAEQTVKGLAVDENGNVYVYSTFMDNYSVVNMDSGATTVIACLQTLGVYGDGESAQTMYYDEISGTIYQAFTSNGNVYRMVTCDIATGKLNVVSYIGDVVYDSANWEYVGDVYQYAGLDFVVPCEHAETEVVGAVNADCTNPGHTGKTVCLECGEVLSEGEVIDALGHSFTEYVSNNDATCTEDGTKTAKCDRCDETDTTVDEGSATGHKYADATCEDPATCEVCGHENGEPLGHNYSEEWSSDENGHWHECTRCGDRADEAEHTPGAEATEENAQVCTECGYEIAPKLEHAHKLTKVEATVTCTEDGHIAYYVCECGKWFADPEGKVEILDKDSVNVKATGHSDKNGDGKCDCCGVEYTAPQTGDNVLVWVGLIVLSIAALACGYVWCRKKFSSENI